MRNSEGCPVPENDTVDSQYLAGLISYSRRSVFGMRSVGKKLLKLLKLLSSRLEQSRVLL